MTRLVYLPCNSCGENQIVELDDGVPEFYLGESALGVTTPRATIVGGSCVHSPKREVEYGI